MDVGSLRLHSEGERIFSVLGIMDHVFLVALSRMFMGRDFQGKRAVAFAPISLCGNAVRGSMITIR